jgi:UDP-GlcNAc:undecaprenyl-phosphate/decaprenyl-phosphate GlcNAc-1-phosphate transferase
MHSLIILGATAFLLSLFLTPAVKNLAHGRAAGAVPRIGGIPIAFAYIAAWALLLATNPKSSHGIWQSLGLLLHVLPAAALVFSIGLISDLKRIEPWHKVVGQIVVALVAYGAGVRIQTLGVHRVGLWSVPLTVAWILIFTNAIRVIDVVDGLASGVGLIVSVSIFFAAFLQHNPAVAFATAPLAGGILGFLRFDFNRSTIRLGESGSLLIGFLLGCYSIWWSQGSARILEAMTPLLVLSVPLLDATLSTLCRFLRRRPLWEIDPTHMYNRLLNRGLSPRKVRLVFYACSAISAAASLLILSNQRPWLVIAMFCGAAWIWIQYLGYTEFTVAARLFAKGGFRRMLNAEIAIRSYEARLKAASTPGEYWQVVEEGLKEFGFYGAHLSIAGSTFDWQCGAPPSSVWKVNVPISDSDCIRLSRAFGSSTHSSACAPFIELLRRTLPLKRAIFVAVGRTTEPLHVEAER